MFHAKRSGLVAAHRCLATVTKDPVNSVAAEKFCLLLNNHMAKAQVFPEQMWDAIRNVLLKWTPREARTSICGKQFARDGTSYQTSLIAAHTLWIYCSTMPWYSKRFPAFRSSGFKSSGEYDWMQPNGTGIPAPKAWSSFRLIWCVLRYTVFTKANNHPVHRLTFFLYLANHSNLYAKNKQL